MTKPLVRTRFAPSPTGMLHIGSARTAIFNWLYARHWGGKFLIRVEDTDKVRSTPEAVKEIFSSLDWLGISSDEPPIFQGERIERHKEVAQQLLDSGKAYRCYCTPEELEKMKKEARQNNLPPLYNGLWRDRLPSETPEGKPWVLRLKSPREGSTTLEDLVQGSVTINHKTLDDMVLLRSDGTPTYMLAVVVDDHDMSITHVIRGDDHLSNTFRQIQIFKAMGWDLPQFGHIPLIHGADGAKLSKRHGAVGVSEYRQEGFLPEALFNYLLRLGWAHGNDEIILKEEAIHWFDLPEVGRSSSRFNQEKLFHLNHVYLQKKSLKDLERSIQEALDQQGKKLSPEASNALKIIFPELQKRGKTLNELKDMCLEYTQKEVNILASALEEISGEQQDLMEKFLRFIVEFSPSWSEKNLEEATREFAKEHGKSLGVTAKALRIALTGRKISPSLFLVMESLGQEWCIFRLEQALKILKGQ